MSVDEDGFAEFLKKEEKPMSKGFYKVWKRYYLPKVSPDVKKLIVCLKVCSVRPYMCVCVCVCVHVGVLV